MTTRTLPELAVRYELTRLGIYYEEQVPFFGGREAAGGAVTDFYIPAYALVLSVIGIYWHESPARRAQDLLQRIALFSVGIFTVYITDEQINRNVRYYVEEALQYRDHSDWGD
jgi:multisubunit Na+/H+ antiporter MnhB subunit